MKTKPRERDLLWNDATGCWSLIGSINENVDISRICTCSSSIEETQVQAS